MSLRTSVMATNPNLPCYSGRAELIVNLLDINDNAPVFVPSHYQESIDDTSPVGRSVLMITVIDQDLGDNARVTLRLSGSGSEDFSIDGNGVIRVTSTQLSADRIPVYRFQVIATDLGMPALSGTASVTIYIRRTNRAPQFVRDCARVQEFCRFVVRENQDITLNFTAVDTDSGMNGRVSYTLRPISPDNPFQISVTGIVTNSRVLDFETADFHQFDIIAEDGASIPLSSIVRVTVTVEDVNEFAPSIFNCDSSVAENEVNAEVVQVRAEDADPFDGLVYSLVSSTDVFRISSSTGVITTRVALDRETTSTYDVTVEVADSGVTPQLSTRRTCAIQVSDVNDNTPVIAGGPFSRTVSENVSVGASVLRIMASDADEGVNAELVYSLEGGNGAFAINASSGLITTAQLLDRETVNSYNLQVVVRDRGEPSLASEEILTIGVADVNDNRCLFVSDPYVTSVPERSPAGVVLSEIMAIDFDLGPNADLRYRFGATNAIVRAIFVINATSGVVSSLSMIPSIASDETGPDVGNGGTSLYIIPIEAFDQGNPSLSCRTNLTVHVTDVRDRGIEVNRTSQEVTVAENSPVGTPVAVFVPTEAREFMAPLRYVITSGNALSLFAINTTSGVVSVNGALDRETEDFFPLAILISDSSSPPLTLQVSLIVNVGDVNDHTPTFTSPFYSGSIAENLAPGQSVQRVQATDSDIGSNAVLSYDIVPGSGDDRFYVDNITGIIYNRVPLDRETASSHIVKVIVRDHGVPSLSSTALVQVSVLDQNDNSPRFIDLPENITISEDVSVPLELFRVRARDEDLGTSGNVVYSLLPSEDSALFSIDNLRGTLTLVSSLDRDVKDMYRLVIVASDEAQPPLSSQQQLLVLVGDANDNSPQFQGTPYAGSVKENEAGNDVVLQVMATDADAGLNGAIQYSLTAPDENLPFMLDAASGEIRLTRAVDYENVTAYEFTVQACDAGIPQHCATATVTIQVVNVNEFRPVFLGVPYFAELSENEDVGEVVIALAALDADRGDTLQFAIVNGNEDGAFEINSATGVISLARKLDFEEKSGYELIVLVSDSGNLTSMTMVTIKILDFNDNAPVFDPLPATILISDEGQQKLVSLSASDEDSGDNGLVNYSLAHVETVNATVSIVTVQAHDNGTPRLATNASITVQTSFDCELILFSVNSLTSDVTFKTLCEVLFGALEPINSTDSKYHSGDNVTFFCVAKTNCPAVVHYTLLKDGLSDVQPSVGSSVYWPMPDLGIADEGYYSCEAKLLGVGRISSDRLAIDIVGKLL